MPAHRRKQSNAMLYTLIIFVGLFIVATTVAVFYYVKAEEHRITHEELRDDLNEYASDEQRNNIGNIVGPKQGVMTSYIQSMVDYLDDVINCVVGGIPQTTSADVKTNRAVTQFKSALQKADKYIDIVDPNMTGLIQVISSLVQQIEDINDARVETAKNLENLMAQARQREAIYHDNYQKIIDEKETLMEDYNDIKLRYDDLSAQLRQTTDDRIQSFKDQYEKEKADHEKTMDELLEKIAILNETQQMLAEAKDELAKYGSPKPDSIAYKPDGKILSIDNKTNTVIINLGSNDHVYRGLTFSVYDKGAYIGEEGQNKAEIEVFDIGDSFSSARIIKSELNRPILQGDTIANLIWDNRKVNEFVIAGDFDLDGDGKIDADADSKIQAVIEKWGGVVTNKITVNTDFLILGSMPTVPEKRPTLDEEIMNPTAMQEYDKALEKYNNYTKLEERAKSLWVPIFTYDKFIYLIGYTEKVGQAGSF